MQSLLIEAMVVMARRAAYWNSQLAKVSGPMQGVNSAHVFPKILFVHRRGNLERNKEINHYFHQIDGWSRSRRAGPSN